MKKLECFLQPSKLEDLEDALWDNGVSGVTITEVRGFGSQRIKAGPRLQEKLKVEVFVPDDRVDEVINTIHEAVRTGKLGDGKIAILPVLDIIRIRTGETGEVAI